MTPSDIPSREPILDELQKLHAIAVREHGPGSRTARLIGEFVAREVANPLPRPLPALLRGDPGTTGARTPPRKA